MISYRDLKSRRDSNNVAWISPEEAVYITENWPINNFIDDVKNNFLVTDEFEVKIKQC